MPGNSGFRCRTCGEWHDDLPFSYHAEAPAYWEERLEGDELSELSSDQCVIKGEYFFVRGLIQIPVTDADRSFEWGVWVSLSEHNFLRMSELWDVSGREAEPPSFGWLATELPTYEVTTLNLKTNVHTRPVGLRPSVELQSKDHRLAVEQQEGIDLGRVKDLAEQLLHGPT